jgi:hypothetical protein
MSLADDLAKLEDLRRTGALTDAEFAQAKAKLLTGDATPANDSVVEKLGEQLAETRYQNELARIDREWQMEREKYMVTAKHGRRYIPTTNMGWATAIFGGIIGAVWTIMAIVMSSAMAERRMADDGFEVVRVLLPLIGLAVTAGAIAYGIHLIKKAEAHNKAFAAYQKRRAVAKPEDFR